MKYKLLLIATLLLSISAFNAEAQVRSHRTYIRPGITNGTSRAEAFRLRQDRRHLRRDVIRFKRNDGRIGPLERRHLRRERRHLKRERFFFQHNRRKV
ncbi:MAG: hypothetical protein K2X48_08770 [Chitinophagaceae bacterium]|nr:hypothetical protein [Chitinophagaceae bacterium]